MMRFTWPLMKNGAMDADFATRIDLSRVELDSSGFLQQILAPLGLAEEDLELRDTEVICEGKEGRVSCTPMHILIAESDMTISGSVGLDKSLDYLLEVPVTENLVGREGYRVLEGTTIKVPIKGTLTKPGFNKEALSAAITDLLGQAAKQNIKKQIEKNLPGLIEGIFGN
jgi:hypothetical protein